MKRKKDIEFENYLVKMINESDRPLYTSEIYDRVDYPHKIISLRRKLGNLSKEGRITRFEQVSFGRTAYGESGQSEARWGKVENASK